jgi:hypothetical protein
MTDPIEGEGGLLPARARVKMWPGVRALVPVHGDRDAVREADARHHRDVSAETSGTLSMPNAWATRAASSARGA